MLLPHRRCRRRPGRGRGLVRGRGRGRGRVVVVVVVVVAVAAAAAAAAAAAVFVSLFRFLFFAHGSWPLANVCFLFVMLCCVHCHKCGRGCLSLSSQHWFVACASGPDCSEKVACCQQICLHVGPSLGGLRLQRKRKLVAHSCPAGSNSNCNASQPVCDLEAGAHDQGRRSDVVLCYHSSQAWLSSL